MKRDKKKLALLTAVFVTLVITAAGALQEKPSKHEGAKINTDELYSQYPTVDLSNPTPESTDAKTRIKRLAKQRRYDKQHIVSSVPGRGTVWFGNDRDAGLTGIPVNQSDVVVVGQVLGAQAYLSEDKGAVYSEFIIQVDEVLKSNTDTPLLPGSSITADR